MIRLLLDAPIRPLVMFIGSLIGGGYGCLQLILVALAARWPIVEGEIVGAHLIQAGTDARGLYERVTYRHNVSGQPFLNDRVRIGPQPQRASIVPATGYPAAASGVVHRYPTGQRVGVRYNPRRPNESVLHAQPNLAVIVILGAAIVTFYSGARGLFWYR